MASSDLHPVRPRPDQIDGFQFKEQLWSDWHGDVLMFGDSRAARYDKGLVADAVHERPGEVANWGVNGAQLQELWWMAKHMTTDLSHVTKIILPSTGGNDLNDLEDSGRFMAKVETKLIKVLLAHAAPGAQVVVTADLEVGPGYLESHPNTHYSEDRRADFNHAMDHLADTTGLFTWRPTPHDGAPPTDGDYWEADQEHMLPKFYEEFVNPVIEEAFGLSTHPTSALDADAWA